VASFYEADNHVKIFISHGPCLPLPKSKTIDPLLGGNLEKDKQEGIIKADRAYTDRELSPVREEWDRFWNGTDTSNKENLVRSKQSTMNLDDGMAHWLWEAMI